MTYGPPLDERARLYAGPQCGALVLPAKPGAETIRVAGELYRRTNAVDRDGRTVYQYAPTKEPRQP